MLAKDIIKSGYAVQCSFKVCLMQKIEQNNAWQIVIEREDNQMGNVNVIRYLDNLNDELLQSPKENLLLELNLEGLDSVSSELIAQFIMLQTTLVRSKGRLRIVEANMDLKSSFDVVMLDKIISVQYVGQDDGSEEE